MRLERTSGVAPQPSTRTLFGAIERLQRIAGNRAVAGLLGAGSKNSGPEIERKASAAPGIPDVHAAASESISGPAGALPHLEPIQRSFGHHDVRHVQAHRGARAAAGARAMGAEAFAMGDHVAFAAAPSLHTAAHEAAHVVQQRRGVQLEGGVGEVGDAYERHADAVADAVVRNESADALLDSLAGGGAGSLAVQRKAKAKPVAIPSMVVTVDHGGLLSDARGDIVGFQGSDGKFYVAVDAKGNKGVPLSNATLGTIRLGTERVIERVEEVTLAPLVVDAVSNGVPPAPQDLANQRLVTFSGKILGVIDRDGSQILRHGAAWEPIAPSSLVPAFAAKLDEQVRVDLDDGRTWMWMSFALRDERAETARWVPPGHAKKEVADRVTAISAQAGKLPSASDDVKIAVDRVIKTIAVISAVEGDFDSKSENDDDHASLGIFQWAMEKWSSAEAGSLGMFFRALKSRATESAKKSERDRSEEDKLYIAAWKQCTDQRIDVSGRQILIGGKPATGAQVESAMSDAMGKGSLRSYQLIAAKDWIDDFRDTVVRPGPSAATSIGHGYAENTDGTQVTLTSGRDTLMIEAEDPATVGSLFTSEKAIANAIMLGVNRPHYVEGALWRAMSVGADQSAAVESRLTELMIALTPAPPAPTGGAKRPVRPVSHHYTVADVLSAGGDAARLYSELRAILWPNRQLDAAAQQRLEIEFKKQALKLYNPTDARRYHRERRFSTVDGSW